MDRIEVPAMAADQGTLPARRLTFESTPRSPRRHLPTSNRAQRRISIAQRFMLNDVIRDPAHAPVALARVANRAACMRREGSPLCSEPWFRRLEANLRRLAGRPAEVEAWYLSAWQRLFATMRRAEREKSGGRS